jgi:hypothetical protein
VKASAFARSGPQRLNEVIDLVIKRVVRSFHEKRRELAQAAVELIVLPVVEDPAVERMEGAANIVLSYGLSLKKGGSALPVWLPASGRFIRPTSHE